MAEIKFAPKEIFNQALKWFVMPTFDLILEYRGGVILVKRKIAPYKNQWALPGLRMYKGEEIIDTLKRIAKQELGLEINPKKAKIIGQYVGKFQTENQRQDLSTCYVIKVPDNQEIKLNSEHFSSLQIATKISAHTGAMYRFYLNKYWNKLI
jgi:ADP-ribose pyrophosphatase YjhB (NUDIX family)